MLLAGGWLLHAALRAWLSHRQAVPLANPDESAYLIAARVLAGGPPADFSYGTLYPAGYPLLITPVFWLTSSPVAAYHGVLILNALVSALIVPLGYVACRRLGLTWRASFSVAMVIGLLPPALFYSQYAMADAIFPVVVLAWLLAVHSWISSGPRPAFGWAVGAALLAGYAFACHARGLVVVACFGVLAVLVFVRKLAPRPTVLASLLALAVTCAVASMLNRHLAAVMYTRGARSLSSQALTRLHSPHGMVLIVEMAGGQLWRLILDSWGVAGIGLAAAVLVLVRRDLVAAPMRLMAGLAIVLTAGIAISSPAALPADQQQTWASGRYLDCMIVAFSLAGAVVLVRCGPRQVLAATAAVLPLAVLTAAFVTGYAGASIPITNFGPAFNFGVPAVLTEDWVQPRVAVATVVALALLAVWAAIVVVPWRRVASRVVPGLRAVAGRSLPARAGVLLAGLTAVSLLAASEMTENVSHAYTAAARSSAAALTSGKLLKPGEQIAIGKAVGWQAWVPQAYQIWWTSPQFFDPGSQSPPTGVSVVEVPIPAAMAGSSSPAGASGSSGSGAAGTPSAGASSTGSADAMGPDEAAGAASSWPGAPQGWHVVAVNYAAGWVAWRSR